MRVRVLMRVYPLHLTSPGFTCLPIVCEQGPVRFCDDNADWKGPGGGNCDDYRVDAPNTKHSQCFSGEAYVACPIACGTCGDCCAAPPPMMGEAGDGDNAAEPECYFYMRYADGSIVSGSKIKETIQLTTTTTATATASAAATGGGSGGGGGEEVVAAVSEAAVGVFSHVDSSWEPAVRSQPHAAQATVCTAAQTSPT
eukprot:COSAG06_NODE_795_length_12228_cov_51.650507_6_plen_198_part_00